MLSLVLLGQSSPVSADTVGEYTVSPVKPVNQIGEDNGYFNLLLQPNQKTTIYADLVNSSKQAAKFKVNVNPAITSDGGAIDYSKNNVKLDKTIPFDSRNYIKLEQTEYSVPANGKIRIPISVTMPNQKFDGRVLSGLYVEKITKSNNTDSSTGKTTIGTKVAYTIAIVLQQNTNKVIPDLNYLKAGPATVNSLAVIQMKFRNPTATIIPNLIFTTKVKRDGKKYINNTSNQYQVAPNTNFHVNLGLDGQRVLPGKYTVDIVAKSGPFYKWHFKGSFTVSQEEADEVNKNSVFPQEKGINIWLIIAIILAIILIGFIIYLLIMRKKNKDKEEEN